MPRFRLFAAILGIMSIFGLHAESFPWQSFNYEIYWHCSFINELAAYATVDINDSDGNFYAILRGRTKDIGGINYCINDTVSSSFGSCSGDGIPPQNVQYIQGYYRKPHAGRYTDLNSPVNYRTIHGQGSLSADGATMECVSLTADVLCLFYYTKIVDFASLAQGVPQDVTVNMPDGDVRTLQIIYEGPAVHCGQPVQQIKVNFTYDGGFSSYPLTVLIDPVRKIPVCFSASIAIGDVKMVYCS